MGALRSCGGEECVVDLTAALPGLPAEMNGLLAAGEPVLDAARRAVNRAERAWIVPPGEARLCAPVPRPGKILCLGHNYRGHIGQGRSEPPEHPTYFCKTVNTVVGPGAAVAIPPETEQADFEAELAVVIGSRARRVAEADASTAVAGYTAFNDISAREVQKRTSQWMLGKSFDSFGPMGPALVTRDEIQDPHALEISLTVNGVERQRANTREMIFRIPFLIAQLSAVMTLEPGDVVATGTPARTPPPEGASAYLRPGDVVAVEIERIGILGNTMTAG